MATNFICSPHSGQEGGLGCSPNIGVAYCELRDASRNVSCGLSVPDVPQELLARTIIEITKKSPGYERTGASRRSTSCSSNIIQSTNPHKRLSKKCRSLSKKHKSKQSIGSLFFAQLLMNGTGHAGSSSHRPLGFGSQAAFVCHRTAAGVRRSRSQSQEPRPA